MEFIDKKYEFDTQEQAEDLLANLPHVEDEEGNLRPSYPHCVVRLGNILLEEGEYDEQGNEINPPLLSTKYHVDVRWVGEVVEEWNEYEIEINGQGAHQFL